MYRLMISTHFAAAHNLMNYQGDCENLHGHNWKVEVTVATRQLDKAGLGVDFKILKKETNRILDLLDHKYLNDLPFFENISPSSENIARFVFEELGKVFQESVTVENVRIWESENACASYSLE
ncbi:MAG: 6-pyruvoyltetrahydropterin/6-carboxytetrahydropterin synthase [Desulfuromonadales bacterium]|nr:6-pyruvoyltetrahydropterin/6-carboxytetrahydropterin synthase [Desulfuromonadales bacterium]